jgi:hypothetical protein
MADGDSASHDDIGGNISHALAVKSSLELGAHESVTLTRVGQAEEVNGEHGEIEGGGDNDEAEDSGHEVLEKKTLRARVGLVNVPVPISISMPIGVSKKVERARNTYNRDILAVAEEDPQLQKSQRSDPGNGKQANPFDACGDAQAKARHGKPEPPAELESLVGSLFVLVGEAGEGHGSEGSGENQGRVQENQTSLSQKAVFYISKSVRTGSSSPYSVAAWQGSSSSSSIRIWGS